MKTHLPSVKKVLASITMSAGLVLAGQHANAQFTTGNIVVLQVGDGAAALTSGSSPITLKEYTTGAANQTTAVSTVAVPVTGTHRLTNSGTATSEGFMALSADSLRLTIAGYDTTTGIAAINGTASAAIARAIDTLSYRAIPGRVAATNTNFSGNNFRSAIRTVGENYYGSGNGAAAAGGTYYFGNVATAASIQTTVNNARTLGMAGGNIYFSTGSGTLGIYKIAGYPTTVTTPVSMIATGTGSSPYAFAINSSETVAYIADDRTSALGGVQKWVSTGGVWAAAATYTLSVGASSGARGMAVDWSGANPSIYVTTTDNRLVKLVDSNATAAFTVLATAPTNTAFRSVAFTPKIPSSCVPPVAAISGPAQFCEGDTVRLVANTGAGLTHQWFNAGISLPGQTDDTLVVTFGGSYTVAVSSSATCSTTSAVRLVTMNAAPAGVISSPGSLAFCMGDSVQLCASPILAGHSYQWLLNNVVFAGAATCVRAISGGNYTLKIVNMTTGCGKTTAAAVVTVHPRPIVGLTRFSADTICNRDSINIHALSNPGYTYRWSINGALQTHTDSIFYMITYVVGASPVSMQLRSIVTNSFGCKDSTSAMTTVVAPRPNPAMTLTSGVLTSVNNHAVYTWNLDGAPVGGASGPTHIPVANGVYTLTATNSFGCDSISAPITITNVGVNNVPAASSIAIFPNPATNMVMVKSAAAVNIVMKDMQGRVVLQQSNAGQLNLSGIANGIYAISVFTKNGELITTQRLLKKD